MLPKFRATVDVSLFTCPSSTVNVSVNPITQKLLVEAFTDPSEGPVRTLRQNITLPRFADSKNIQHTVNPDGILEVIITFVSTQQVLRSVVFVTSAEGVRRLCFHFGLFVCLSVCLSAVR